MSELVVYKDLLQGTDEWLEARRGLITASVIDSLITVGSPDPLTVACPTCTASPLRPCVSSARKEPTPIKTIHAARTEAASKLPPVYRVASNDTAKGIVTTLVAERVKGQVEPSFMGADMERGVEHEPVARDYYAEHYAPVEQVGFMVRGSLGYSPDGLVGDDGLIEIKCPRAKGHLNTVVADEVPAYHMAQLQAGLLVSGRKWVDFISFNAGMPLYVKRVTPDPAWQQAIRDAVDDFEARAGELTDNYLSAAVGLHPTEPINNNLGLVF